MKPVDQTEIGADNPRANCLMAAVASILEVSVESLPDVYELEQQGVSWWSVLERAVAPRGLVPVFYGQGSSVFPRIAPSGYHIAIGQSPRNPKNTHAVVALDGKIVHDPHPSRSGLLGPINDWALLVPAELPPATPSGEVPSSVTSKNNNDN